MLSRIRFPVMKQVCSKFPKQSNLLWKQSLEESKTLKLTLKPFSFFQFSFKNRLSEIFQTARYYEFCYEPEMARAALQPIWSDIDEDPNVEQLSHDESWEALFLAGGVLSLQGTNHQLRNYGSRAIDTLSRAREIAVAIGARDKIAETEKEIGTAYWRLGEYENAVAYLNTALENYSESEKLTNRICLYAQANLPWLLVKIGQPEAAFEMVERIKPFIDEQLDLWLKTRFYNQAASVFVLIGNYKQAIPFLEKVVEYAARTKNNIYLGSGLNNLSNAYLNLDRPDFLNALRCVDDALRLFSTNKQFFAYAISLETKSKLLLDAGDLPDALSVINESVEILQKGENYCELCDSLWTRTRIYVAQGELNQTFQQFYELLKVAHEKLSLLEVERFIAEFKKLVFIPYGIGLEEKERNFRRHLFDEALRESGGIVTTTAKRLGVLHQTFSQMIKKYPDLVEKHQVKLRNRSVAAFARKNEPQKNASGKLFALKLQNDRLQHLGLKKGTILSIEQQPLDALDLSKLVMICDSHGDYHCGFLVDAFGMFAFEFERGMPERTFLPEEITEAGRVLGIYNAKTGETAPFENY